MINAKHFRISRQKNVRLGGEIRLFLCCVAEDRTRIMHIRNDGKIGEGKKNETTFSMIQSL